MATEDELATYILPIRASDTGNLAELSAYLRFLARSMRVIVVDGSAPEVFAEHARAFGDAVDHRAPDTAIPGVNGKVRNVLTALAVCETEKAIVGDDDVRYDPSSLRSVLHALDEADVVRPQNYFSPLPWHACADTSRMLVNRALDGDWPGTLGIRRSALPRGYNPDALFENFELVRTVRARGGREAVRRDIYVRRLPPTTTHYFRQRVRQAYDEFARPVRLAAALAIVPVLAFGVARGNWAAPGAIASAAVALAAAGYLRDGGSRYFPWAAIPLAPLWALERGVCAWLAVYERMRYGGVRYAGRIVRDAVSSQKELKERWAA